jgi:hypothetical protein
MQIDQLNQRINQLLTERNATGLAIDHALNGVLPKQHGLLSRLQMLSTIAVQRDELLAALDKALIELVDLDGSGDVGNWISEPVSILVAAVAKAKGGAS